MTMRFSLRWLLIAVAFVAVSLVALINANSIGVIAAAFYRRRITAAKAP
jgi:hypothetical protein